MTCCLEWKPNPQNNPATRQSQVYFMIFIFIFSLSEDYKLYRSVSEEIWPYLIPETRSCKKNPKNISCLVAFILGKIDE